jgi:hypothetical protein
MLAAVALAATGCSSSGSSSAESSASFDGAWSTADEVIASVGAAGFDCGFDKTKNLKQVLTEHPVTKKPLGGSLILCQGFQVLLQDNPADYTATLRKDCAAVTKTSLESPAMTRVVIVGDNYVISGTGPDQAFPAAAKSADLAKAFNGKEETLLAYYQKLCAGIPAIEGSPAPTSAL